MASSTVRNFHNNWLLHSKFLEARKVWWNIWLIENWKCQIFFFEIKRAKMDKILKFLKDRFSVISGPMDMIFGINDFKCQKLFKTQRSLTATRTMLGTPNYMHLIELYNIILEWSW